MQINKRGKLPRKQPRTTSDYSDFASGFEDSKFDKFKPALKVLIVIIFIMSAVWGVSTYLDGTDKGADKDDTTSDTRRQGSEVNETISNGKAKVTDEKPTVDTSPPTASEPKFNSSSGAASSSKASTYDPNKCNSLNSEAKSLRAAADRDYATFQRALNNQKDFGDIYSEARVKYGPTAAAQTEASRVHEEQKAQITQLQDDWKDRLAAGNTAYDAFQKCQDANLSQ